MNNENNDIINNKIPSYDKKVLPPFKFWCLQNFPYIEADFDALTNYQLMCKIVEYLNGVIEQQNAVTDQTSKLTTAYNNLVTTLSNSFNNFTDTIDNKIDDFENDINKKVQDLTDFVNKYFDNLDVQNEINNKLDDMVRSGELQNIISENFNNLFNFTYQDELKDNIKLTGNSITNNLMPWTNTSLTIYSNVDNSVIILDGAISLFTIDPQNQDKNTLTIETGLSFPNNITYNDRSVSCITINRGTNDTIRDLDINKYAQMTINKNGNIDISLVNMTYESGDSFYYFLHFNHQMYFLNEDIKKKIL